jgi:hypothetical protein
MQGSKTRLLDKSNKKRDLTPDDFEIMSLMSNVWTLPKVRDKDYWLIRTVYRVSQFFFNILKIHRNSEVHFDPDNPGTILKLKITQFLWNINE